MFPGVENPNVVAIPLGLVVLFVAGFAEWLHARRCRAVARLAFGPTGLPRGWTRAAPALRTLSAGFAAWGLALLALSPPEALNAEADAADVTKIEDLQRVVLLLDVSPSMNIIDAGPEGELRRRDRVRDVVEAIFPRIALGRTRFSVVAFFTSARPVVVDASDVNVIRNVLDSLPLIWAFEPGKTNLIAGLEEVEKLARDWPPQSTTLLVCTDGDTTDMSKLPKLPRSIHQVKLLGVGDPIAGTFIDNHDSRQQAGILRQLAAELHGSYFDINSRHLPTSALTELSFTPPPPAKRGLTWKDAALLAVALAAAVLTLLPIALEYFGASWNADRELPAVRRAPRAEADADEEVAEPQEAAV
jgi:Ca-activated chloride channel family protein